jgi:predicted CXXCH cytochrome family protein
MAKLLLAKSPDLCLACHKELKERMSQTRTHPPAGRDCLRCHKPHFSAEPSLIFEPVAKLCSECHDVKGKTFGKEHLDIDAALIDCKSCHDPHASNDPKFFKKNVHPPFAGRSCENCHITGKQ